MEKKVWSTPHANLENFEANEYVAACWSVVCTVPMDTTLPSNNKNNDPGRLDAKGLDHRIAYCGQADHYQIFLDDNGVPYKMMETHVQNSPDLECTPTLSDYTTPRDFASITQGETLYWTTRIGNNVWQHKGAVTGSSNHS